MDSDVIKAKSKFPIDFINELYKEYSEKNADKILNGLCSRRYTTLRVNTLKSSIENVKKVFDENDIQYENISLIKNSLKVNDKNNEKGKALCYNNAFIIKNKNENDLQKLDIYKEGKIYIQSLSSMIPPLLLDLKQDENVLDMASAPGSKTTEMSSLMNNTGKIIANEIDRIRFEKLNYNIKMQGATNIETINKDGTILWKIFPEQFDKVLLDTPCSGEGRFEINDKKSYQNWSTNLVKNLVKTQKELMESAIKCCKKGGTIVYSTCTLNRFENEEIIDYALKNFNVRIDKINIDLHNTIKGNTKGVNEKLSETLKIVPNENFEGFYIAKLIKL